MAAPKVKSAVASGSRVKKIPMKLQRKLADIEVLKRIHGYAAEEIIYDNDRPSKDGYRFLARGNPSLTRSCRSRANKSKRTVYTVYAKSTYEVTGIFIPADIYAQAEKAVTVPKRKAEQAIGKEPANKKRAQAASKPVAEDSSAEESGNANGVVEDNGDIGGVIYGSAEETIKDAAAPVTAPMDIKLKSPISGEVIPADVREDTSVESEREGSVARENGDGDGQSIVDDINNKAVGNIPSDLTAPAEDMEKVTPEPAREGNAGEDVVPNGFTMEYALSKNEMTVCGDKVIDEAADEETVVNYELGSDLSPQSETIPKSVHAKTIDGSIPKANDPMQNNNTSCVVGEKQFEYPHEILAENDKVLLKVRLR